MRVGIIGGGQLAQMLCEAAQKLNVKTVVLDPNPKCSASFVADEQIIANYDDINALEKLAEQVFVVTYEFENVDARAIELIDEKYHNVMQGAKPLKLANDRLYEKQMAKKAGFEPVIHAKIDNFTDLNNFVDQNGFPIVLKTRQMGYDGKGQQVIENKEQFVLENVEKIIQAGAIAEQMVDLAYELSVIVIRNKNGDIRFIPSTRNTHRENILFTSEITSADVYPKVLLKVSEYIKYHNLFGIITVEVFVSQLGDIIFNEIAPRPHNSGHYSIEACNHSQFEMHIRAICDMPLPAVELIDDALMVNVLGQDYDLAQKYMQSVTNLNIYFHDYFKDENRVNRKVAHITAVGAKAVQSLKQYQKLIKEQNE